MSTEDFDLSADENSELIAEFLSESDEHLQVLNQKLLEAEESLQDGSEMSEEDLNAMFRGAHTIKGTASFFGLGKIVELTHEMETILTRLKNKEMILSAVIVDALFSAFDTLELLFAGLKKNNTEDADITESVRMIKEVLNPASVVVQDEPEVKEKPADKEIAQTPDAGAKTMTVQNKQAVNEKYLEQYISEAEQGIEQFESTLLSLEEGADGAEAVDVLFRMMHTLKGSSGIINCNEIGTTAHGMENILSIFRAQKKVPSAAAIILLFKGIDFVKEMMASLKQNRYVDIDVTAMCAELDDYYRRLDQDAGEKDARVVPSKGAVAASGSAKTKDTIADIHAVSDDVRARIVDMLASDDVDIFRIVVSIREAAFLKSMKALLAVERLRKKGEVIFVDPEPELFDTTCADLMWFGVIFCSTVNEKDIRSILSIDCIDVESIERIDQKECVGTVPEPAPVIREPKPARTHDSEGGKTMVEEIKAPKTVHEKNVPVEMSTIRIDSRKLDTLMNLSGELVTLRAQFARLVTLFEEDNVQQKEIEATFKTIKSFVEAANSGLSQVSQDAITETVQKVRAVHDDMNSHLTALDAKFVKNNIATRILNLDELTSMLGKLSSDIQSGVMQTRMVPVEGVFTRFKRIVRDIAKELGKTVNLNVEGEDTELDKKIVDSLGDPLTHMIRNAVDHGMDDTETRLRLGKPETGTVTLRALHRGNNICIEIGDDGRGIDPEKLVQSAIKKELITQEQGDRMNEKEKLNLMFLPGFSTAAKVTGISGRGVGMDVVRNMISSVNGVVDIETELEKGTTFIMKIPLTLAIIQALLIVISDVTYALPLESVTEIIKISPDEIYSIDGNATVKLRDHALSLVELEKVIQLSGNERPKEGSKKVVVITDGENQVGIVVDSLIGEDEIVIKSLTEHFAHVKGISGASILGDGSVALILDPLAIIAEAK